MGDSAEVCPWPSYVWDACEGKQNLLTYSQFTVILSAVNQGEIHAATVVRQEVQEADRQLAFRPVFLRLTTNDEQARRTAGFFVAWAIAGWKEQPMNTEPCIIIKKKQNKKPDSMSG